MPPNPPDPVTAPRRLYMDNAATSVQKPREVMEAIVRYMTERGASAGRGAYREAVDTGAEIAECRRRICRLFNGEKPEHVVFTLNCSDALNLALHGLVDSDRAGHAVCTHVDHNSVLRPLAEMESRGWLQVTRVPVDGSGMVDPDAVRKALRPDTRVVALTHVSNVTGTVQPIQAVGRVAREAGVPFVVDAAQSAGHVPVDVQADFIDLLAAPGHKGLLGPTGTGFLYLRPGMEKLVRTVREGGTGSVSEQPTQPQFLPDKYEPGSHNAMGIIGLSAAVQWVARRGVESLAAHDQDLVRTFIEGVADVEGLTYYGPRGVKNRVGVFSVRVEGFDPHELSAVLEASYGILTRSGIHCAPLAHEAIGTASCGGATRFSFGPFLSKQDVKYATDALAEIAETARNAAGVKAGF